MRGSRIETYSTNLVRFHISKAAEETQGEIEWRAVETGIFGPSVGHAGLVLRFSVLEPTWGA
jgi:hypothetical protein